ncbi:MAG: putative 3-oxoacyl-(acyl carrier protein) reductase [Gemmatimonadetes bacterium]|nr:putative 3-oxoacyl-(acyl carrier protein) reductase [Gemmatimonadota bacterium]
MAYSVAGKVVLVTGAARGIGAETARLLAARGARLSLVGMEPDRLRGLATELGEGHVWFACDVTDQAALDRAVAGTVAALGGIDVVIANAGIAGNGTVAVAPVEALVRVIEVNLIGVVRTVKSALPHVIERQGYFLLVSSAAALAPLPGISTYAASKIGVEHFGSVLRLELAHRGVQVGVAHPSWIDTDLVRDQQRDFTTFNQMLKATPGPFGRVTSLAECAEAFVEGIEKRRRKIYVPRSLAPLAAIRQVFSSPLMERLTARTARKTVPRLEAEVQALGRAFGASSVETTERAVRGAEPSAEGVRPALGSA